jgi:hypothetical protein
MTSAVVVLLIGWIAGLLLVLLWALRELLWPSSETSGVDPILGARDRVAVYRPSGNLIQPHPNVLVPMPDNLTTQGEMVAWMTKEMPKVVERLARR